MKKTLVPYLLFLALAMAFAVYGERIDTLSPKGRVSDFAGQFSAAELTALENFLQEVERKTTAEIAVVTVKNLDGGDIDDYATRLFERWGIGKKGKDNGALLIAAIEDRKVRIEVGYGLEGVIPDARAGRILDESVIPYFKIQRYAAGLTEGAKTLAQLVAQDAGISLTNSLPGHPRPKTQSSDSSNFWPVFVFIVIFIILLAIANRRGRGGGGWIGGPPGGRSPGGSSGFGGFGGGRSGGGGASRGW